MSLKITLKRSLWLKEIVRAWRNLDVPPWNRITGRGGSSTSLATPHVRRVLIATGGAGYAAAKRVESLLAASLLAEGVEVDVLLCDGALPACFQTTLDFDSNEAKFASHGTSKLNCMTCFKPGRKTFSDVGARVLTIGELLPREELSRLEVISRVTAFSQIRSYSKEGVGLGEHAYAGALRFYARSSLNDKHSEKVLRRYFLAALIAHAASRALFEDNHYDRVVLHHGIYVPQGIIADTAKFFDIPTVTWHVAYRKRCFIFSHGGTYHHTLMSEPNSRWENLELSDDRRSTIESYLSSRWSGSNDQVSFSKGFSGSKKIPYDFLESGRPTVLLLTNVLWDAQLHYPANAFRTMIDWVFFTIDHFSKRYDLQLVIRVHPAEVSGTLPSRQKVADEIARRYPNLPENIVIIGPEVPANTYELAKQSDCALIYGTKAGVELTSMGIPTIVAGEAWIKGKGVTVDVKSPEHYEEELFRLPYRRRLPTDTRERALKYAYHFFFRRMIFFSSLTTTKDHRVVDYSFSDWSELLKTADRGLEVVIRGILSGSEFEFDQLE
jgi:hypothetical protein